MSYARGSRQKTAYMPPTGKEEFNSVDFKTRVHIK